MVVNTGFWLPFLGDLMKTLDLPEFGLSAPN
jgi:hypothetical protein